MRTTLFLVLALAGPALAEDWPHVRGPRYDGVSTEKNLVASWPPSGPRLLWSRELGQGYSGIVVAAGTVFTQFQTRTGQFVLALDAVTGDERWRRRVDWPWQPAGAYPGPYATPTWHEDRIYYTTPAGLAGCLDAASGRPVWSIDLKKKFAGEGTGFGYAAPPLIEGGKVILPVGGKGASMVALAQGDGTTVWADGDDPASYCGAFPVSLNGKQIIVGYLQNSLVGHDLATGKRLWREELSDGYDEHSAWPLYAEPHLLLAGPFRKGARVVRLGEGSPKVVWRSKELSNDVCSSVLVGQHVYGFDLLQLQASAHRPSRGRFRCLDFTTGKVCWDTDQVGQATVLAADGKLFLVNDSGWLILARATPDAYEELARVRLLEGVCWTPPALSEKRLYLRDRTRILCLDVGTVRAGEDPGARAHLPRTPWFEWGALLSREPEYPHDAPTVRELYRWFLGCFLGVFAPAAGVASVVWGVLRGRAGAWPGVVFATVAFLLGLIGTTWFSQVWDACILTWPASLYTAFRVTLATIEWAETQPERNRPRRVSRGVTLLFLAFCFGYYRLCLVVGYVMAWSFLAGFLPAALPAIVAARTARLWLRILADLIGFSVFFWVGGLLPGWKDVWVS